MGSIRDNLYHLFSHAPAYLLCKFKCVSSKIDFNEAPNFCGEQARNMLQRGDMHIFVFPDIPAPMGTDLYHLFENGPSPGLPIQFMDLFNRHWRILASWNGLVVVEFEIVDVKTPTPCLCNPVTGSWALLRSPLEEYNIPDELKMHIIIVPTDTHGSDYKLICIAGVQDRWSPPYVMKEYNPVVNNWQVLENKIEFGARQMDLDHVAVVNDNLYMMSDHFDYGEGEVWPLSSLPYIVHYSLIEKNCNFLPLPDEAVHDPFRGAYGVFTWGSRWTSTESLCLVRYGAQVSWVLIDRINIGELGINFELEDEYDDNLFSRKPEEVELIRGFGIVNVTV
ncbi:uncharacterized protein LOC130719401 [Lotus japonicus]|uniref:uncharacterized protein LOC130719401 n=1 Tax=Lotus japonicus TaxID=34305 RepID=UPI0025864570|nr:uncharacterized protein LOC130719401 [Lotus japonicus]